jgi:hypothetical protein
VEANPPVRAEGVASRSASAVAVKTCLGCLRGCRYEVDDRDHSKLAREAIVLSSDGAVRRTVAGRMGKAHSLVRSARRCRVTDLDHQLSMACI